MTCQHSSKTEQLANCEFFFEENIVEVSLGLAVLFLQIVGQGD